MIRYYHLSKEKRCEEGDKEEQKEPVLEAMDTVEQRNLYSPLCVSEHSSLSKFPLAATKYR